MIQKERKGNISLPSSFFGRVFGIRLQYAAISQLTEIDINKFSKVSET
jgi:hypothetical protein